MSVLKFETAVGLGFSFRSSAAGKANDVAGGILLGFHMPVTITVHKKGVKVTAFVPMVKWSEVEEDGKIKVSTDAAMAKENLLGMDYLQRAKATLDYSRPHGFVLSEGDGVQISYLRKGRITPAQKRALMEHMKHMTSGNGKEDALSQMTRQVRSMLKK